jgi:purine-binding chemotaxis protein CheW
MADREVQEEFEEEGEEELETNQYLVFSIKSQEFAFQAIRVQEITAPLDITGVPNAPPYVEGIVNLRGRLATLINLRRKLGFETKERDEDTRIVVVEQGSASIGILVDAVEEVIRIPDEMVQRLHEATGTPASEETITGVGVLDDRLITLLDVDKVLTKAELTEAGIISRKMEQVRQEAEKAARETAPQPAGQKPQEAPSKATQEPAGRKPQEAPGKRTQEPAERKTQKAASKKTREPARKKTAASKR